MSFKNQNKLRKIKNLKIMIKNNKEINKTIKTMITNNKEIKKMTILKIIKEIKK